MKMHKNILAALFVLVFLVALAGPVQALPVQIVLPVANAGPDQSVDTLAAVTLDGSGSSDPDNDLPLSYQWTQTGGEAVLLDDDKSVTPLFTAPGDPAVLTFTLVVTDSVGNRSEPDEVVITVTNPPLANAGPDQMVFTSSFVTLDGTDSTDPDQNFPLTYLWTQTGGTAVTLSDATASKPTFVAPGAPNVLTFSLSVTDSLGMESLVEDTVTITVDLAKVYLPMILKQIPPAAFGKSSPANGSIVLETTQVISWAATSPVTNYEYCYDTTNDGICSQWIPNGLSTSASIPGLQYGTTYYWQVRAWRDLDGPTYANGSLADFWSFRISGVPAAFTKTSPTNGYLGQPITPTLAWAATIPVTNYEYCYDKTNDGICTDWISNGTATSVTLPTLQFGSIYYWQVRAWYNGEGPTYADGSLSAFWWFKPLAYPLNFYKTAPANGANDQSNTPVISWTTTTPVTKYEYCIDTTNDNACTTWVGAGMNTSVTLPKLLDGTTYYWQVRAWNSTNGPVYADLTQTTFYSFATRPLPALFYRAGPISGAINLPITPTIYWTPSAYATHYEYCYDTTNDGKCTSWILNGASTSVTLPTLTNGTIYYWQVRAWNSTTGPVYANGALNPFWSFTTIYLDPIKNGGFESGDVSWTQFSTHGWDLILNTGQSIPLVPHTGSWLAWLGGGYDETSKIYQTVFIPRGLNWLNFWYFTESSDVCANDVFGILVGGEIAWAQYICNSNNTGGWVHWRADVSKWGGTTKLIEFVTIMDSINNSSVFIDDISLEEFPPDLADQTSIVPNSPFNDNQAFEMLKTNDLTTFNSQ